MGCSSSNTAQNSTCCRVVMIGLNKAGKTQILYFLKLREPVQTIPTIGVNVETVPGPRGVQFSISDVGGDSRLRPSWRQHYERVDGVIFVVDSADPDRLPEAKDALSGELSNRSLRGVPLLVLANKIDLPGAVSDLEVQKQLKLKAIIDRTWTLEGVCGLSGEKLDVAMSDLERMIRDNRSKMMNASKKSTV